MPATAFCLVLCAFCLPLTLVGAQVFGYLAVVLGVWDAARHREGPEWKSPIFLLGLLYAALAVASLWTGLRPEKSLSRLHRLLLLGLIPVTARQLRQVSDLWLRMASALVLAAAARAVCDLIRFPIHTWGRGLEPADFGSMRDPQFYLAGLLLALGLRQAGRQTPAGTWSASRLLSPGLISLGAAFCTIGVLLHQKRGVWLAGLLAFVLLVCLLRRWRWLLGLGLAALLVLALPFTRARLEALRDIWNPRHGDRALLWKTIAPRLIAAHPGGMGYEALTNEDLRAVHPGVQPKLDHLHNNALQVTAELGWAGLGVWSVWMLWGLAGHIRRLRLESDPAAKAILAATLAVWVGLHLNGMVENNFGDTEFLILFCLLLGSAATPRDHCATQTRT